ncbi:metal ABC transporter permease [Motilimonas cestriensis]|uniref:Metal ABC transporter permease n=1 Tax=Motilimonas cestriensis TaxID=2742685 RepID=A0ABS8WAZ0_9GAMM|nr:metal ABC transporter permease [Motilimonas cestriensis]MCE2595440.1 metal ABC transporter permease [Motilimonas cestriensis]
MTEHIWLLAPLCCGALALVSNLILGRQVLKRGIIFIDLAMAQVSALGMLIITFYWPDLANQYELVPLLGACALALVVGSGIAWLEAKKVDNLEALIGIFYVLSACLAILLVSQAPHAHEHATSLLHGQLLWSSCGDVAALALLAGVLVSVRWFQPRWLDGVGFYCLFALSIPLLVQSLGVYLEFAMLVVPAVAATYCLPRWRDSMALMIGLLGLIAGFALSMWLDLPSGPAVVLMICVLALVLTLAVRTKTGETK